jgi:hypothetical protein
MNPLMKIFIGAALSVGLAAVRLPAQTALNAGNLPLWFEANHGQSDATAAFIAHGHDSEFLMSATSAQIILRKSTGETATAWMKFAGANPAAQISGDSEFPGQVNYFLGNNPAQWRPGVPTFAKVRVENLYPGVNAVYYGNGRQLEYDFDLAPGIDPKTIAIHFDGAEKISVNPQGELVVRLNGSEIVQHQPVVYQNAGATRHEISGGYKLLDAHTVTFALGGYDHRLPLVIDPILSFSTYFGGNGSDIANAIAVDRNGFIYVAGETLSTIWTNASAGAFQTNFHGGTITGDAFVAKFDSTGKTNLYFTYLGGSDNEAALGLAVDNSGNAYLTGWTESPDFPITSNAWFGKISGHIFKPIGAYPTDAFVAELNTNGGALIYSTYLGGNGVDVANAIAVDSSGTAYIAGYTSSTNLPVTAGVFQKSLLCTNAFPGPYNFNAFVAEIAPNRTNLNYCSYLGGHNYDQATGIAIDTNGFIYVAGLTASTNFPTTNALAGFTLLNSATNATPSFDAFVSKFQPNFAGLVYSTFLGGTNSDYASGIAVDGAGNACVVGTTISTDFPYTTNLLASFGTNLTSFIQTNYTGYVLATNSFLAQITWNGTNTGLGHSLTFGGYGVDVANGVALDAADNIFIVGTATSMNFPVTPASLFGSLRATNSGGSDVFVTVFKADWSSLLYSSYLGGALNDVGNAIAVDGAGNAYLAGQTFSIDFPSFNAYQPALNSTSKSDSTSDAFLTKISPAIPTPQLTLTSSATNVLVSWMPLGEESPAFFSLETTTNLLVTNGWTTVTNSPVSTNGGIYIYQINPTNPARFFRLQKF